MVRLQEDPIRVDELLAAVASEGDGAVTLFLGTVRNRNQGRNVTHLEYHAYPEMALRQMRRIAEETAERFAASSVGIIHRTGSLQLGEASVAIAVATPHRAQAFEACRFAIDTLKARVPIWKKEFFEGGEVWIETPGDSEIPPA